LNLGSGRAIAALSAPLNAPQPPNNGQAYGAVQTELANDALAVGVGIESTKYYAFSGGRVAMRRQETGVRYMFGDQLGSSSLIVDYAGSTVSQARYRPWGEVRFETGAGLGTDFTYTGQRRSSYGTISFPAREYSPVLGRFVSADTIVPRPGDPQSLNRYAYVSNSPVIRVDPSGHGDCNIHKEDCLPLNASAHAKHQYYVREAYRTRTRMVDAASVIPRYDVAEIMEYYGYERKSSALPRGVQGPLERPKFKNMDAVAASSRFSSRVYQYSLRQQSLDSARDRVLRKPDYSTTSVQYSFAGALGIGGSKSTDKFGNLYYGIVGSFGIPTGLPFSFNYETGRINPSAGRYTREEETRSFLTGIAHNGTAGAVIGGGATSPDFFSSTAPVAAEFGLMTPQFGYNASYTFLMVDKAGTHCFVPDLFDC
jgi:RHS repeat-associated protein